MLNPDQWRESLLQQDNKRLREDCTKYLVALAEAAEALEQLRRGHGTEVSALCYPALNTVRAALEQ